MSEEWEDPDKESWEVRAFEEDVTMGNLLGCTWPPRSYTCTFCRRQFRSAQALGGHMNVHRRERATLQQQQTGPPPPPTPPTLSSNNIVPNGLCCNLIYALPNNSNNPDTCQPTKAERPYSTTLPKESPAIEEVDLELRLGQRPLPRP